MLKLAEAAKLAGVPRTTIMRAIRSGRLPATQIDDGDYSIDAVKFARIFSARPLMRDPEARDQIVQDETSSTIHDNSSEARSPPTILADPPESRSGRTLASHLAAIRAALVRFSADQPATNEKPVVNARAGFSPQAALTDSPPTSDEPASVAGDASFGAAHDSEARGELLATPIRPPPTPPEGSSHELENPRAVEPMAVDSVSDDLMATLAESPDARVEPTLRPNRAAVGGAFFERATDPRAKPNNPSPSTKGRLFTAEPAANAGEAPANAFARYERMSSTIHAEAITQRSADAPLGLTAISDNSSASDDASLMTARMALLNAEIRGLRDLLAEVKASREELRQDRDDWRRRAESLPADQRAALAELASTSMHRKSGRQGALSRTRRGDRHSDRAGHSNDKSEP